MFSWCWGFWRSPSKDFRPAFAEAASRRQVSSFLTRLPVPFFRASVTFSYYDTGFGGEGEGGGDKAIFCIIEFWVMEEIL